jgi:hypothetical protein
LAGFLGAHASLKAVFLNGCSTEAQVEGLLRAGVPAVIATAQEVADAVATEFAANFYRHLGSGVVSVKTAYDLAVYSVRMHRGDDPRALTTGGATRAADRWPWLLRVRPGSERVIESSLADLAGDPLFGLPRLPADVGFPDRPFQYLRLLNRGSVVTRQEFEGPIEVSFDWRWVDHAQWPLYGEIFAVCLRTHGEHRPKHDFGITDGLVLYFNTVDSTGRSRSRAAGRECRRGCHRAHRGQPSEEEVSAGRPDPFLTGRRRDADLPRVRYSS